MELNETTRQNIRDMYARWSKSILPAALEDTQMNGYIVQNYIRQKLAGEFSVANLDIAVKELDKLGLIAWKSSTEKKERAST